MSNIHVGAKVKVISGGRYLGKEGIVNAMTPHGPVGFFKVLIDGSFPRSKNKTRQEFMISDLKLLQNAPGVIEMTAGAPITAGDVVVATPNGTVVPLAVVKPQGGQHTVHTPMPTKADDAEIASFGVQTPEPIQRGLFGNKLASKFAPSEDTAPHLIVKALAGCGKSTSMLHGVRHMRNDWRCLCAGNAGVDSSGIPKCKVCENGVVKKLAPSRQQQAIWDAMSLSRDAKSVCMVAFNKSIADELEKKVPPGVTASTMHRLGFKSVMQAFGRVSVNEYRVQNIICELAGKFPNDPKRSSDDLWRNNRVLLKATEELVSKCKMNLVGIDFPSDAREMWHEALSELASYYEIDMDGGNQTEVFDLVPRVLDRCADVRKDMSVCYDDQVWLPVYLSLPVMKYDVLIVDESQDLNKCQQALTKMHGRRIIMVGDRNQAIYAWAGADSAAMDRMERELTATERGCNVLPLTQTRRCGKAIVRECQKIVPEFEAFETNPEGVIRTAKYPSKTVPVEKSFMVDVRDGDMILCRCNAPLVSTCFRFLKANRKAWIQGRNIGQGLVSTVKKLKASSIADLSGKLDEWRNTEIAKETAKRNPNENKLINIDDRYDCLMMFIQDQQSVPNVIARIEGVFTDKNNPGVKLSSIHRAKGTEADNVFLLQLKGASVPHPLAKSDWAKEGERCCFYVAQSRAIHTLTYVYDSE